MQDWQWQVSRSGADEVAFKYEPLFYFFQGRLIVNYQKRPLRGTKEEPRDKRLTPLTPAQEGALNTVDRIAFEHALPVEQQVGDMQFFNNLCILHARTAFIDGQSSQTSEASRPKFMKRHLTRMIFRDDEMAWAIPAQLEETWRSFYDHDSSVECFPLHPKPWEFSLAGHD
jgi:hypothetical protein